MAGARLSATVKFVTLRQLVRWFCANISRRSCWPIHLKATGVSTSWDAAMRRLHSATAFGMLSLLNMCFDYLSSSLLSHGPDRPRTNSCDSTGSAEHSTHEQSPPTQKKWKDLLRIDRVFGSALRRVPHQAFETLIRFYSSRPLFGGAWLTKDEILDEANKLFDALTSQRRTQIL